MAVYEVSIKIKNFQRAGCANSLFQKSLQEQKLRISNRYLKDKT